MAGQELHRGVSPCCIGSALKTSRGHFTLLSTIEDLARTEAKKLLFYFKDDNPLTTSLAIKFLWATEYFGESHLRRKIS